MPEQSPDSWHTMPALPDSASGIIQLEVSTKPGTTPAPIPFEEAASLPEHTIPPTDQTYLELIQEVAASLS